MEINGGMGGPSALDILRVNYMDGVSPSAPNRMLAMATGQNPSQDLDAHLVATTSPESPSTYGSKGKVESSGGVGTNINITA